MTNNSETQSTAKKTSIWNVPNILTITRVFLIIPFVILLLGANAGWFGEDILIPCVVADVIFGIASLTDLFDGKIARKRGLVTNFGKFMDPLADKLLVCSALICLVQMELIPAWVVLIIIAREFIISGFRLVAADAGVVIAASYWGKFKTTFQMIMVILMIATPLLELIGIPLILVDLIMWIALILTVVSLCDYMIKNWDVMK
jgi:CDP-diacylglycerol--glycerol-3-phosphate 3-phosphatidyltransferase